MDEQLGKNVAVDLAEQGGGTDRLPIRVMQRNRLRTDVSSTVQSRFSLSPSFTNRSAHRASSIPARRRWRQLLLLAALTSVIAAPQSRAQRDGVADALAGHSAEMRQRAGNDPMRRAFFFDPVDVEGPNPGVPCDHVVARRPEATAGAGWVALIDQDGPPRRRLRVWGPPGASPDAEAAARAYAADIGFMPARLAGVRRFVWCR